MSLKSLMTLTPLMSIMSLVPIMSRFASCVSFHLERRGELIATSVLAAPIKIGNPSFPSLSPIDPQDRRDGNVSSFADMFLYILIHITLIP